MQTANPNWSAGTRYQYIAFATKISQLANVGIVDPVTTSIPISNEGYFPPARIAAIIGWDPETFLAIAAAFNPKKPRSCGRAL